MLLSNKKYVKNIHSWINKSAPGNISKIPFYTNITSFSANKIYTNMINANAWKRCISLVINPFQANVPILYPLKTPRNQRLARNRLMNVNCKNNKYKKYGFCCSLLFNIWTSIRQTKIYSQKYRSQMLCTHFLNVFGILISSQFNSFSCIFTCFCSV